MVLDWGVETQTQWLKLQKLDLEPEGFGNGHKKKSASACAAEKKMKCVWGVRQQGISGEEMLPWALLAVVQAVGRGNLLGHMCPSQAAAGEGQAVPTQGSYAALWTVAARQE